MAVVRWEVYKDAALLHLMLAAVLFCCSCRSAGAQPVAGEDDVITPVPYLIFVNSRFIYRMFLDGTDLQILLRDQANGIEALDFHYELDYMFWSNSGDRTIKRARLNGTEITTVVRRKHLLYPAGLAVDWILNKLYWTDRDLHTIKVLDLTTLEIQQVLSTGSGTLPLGLAIYPYLEQGWLFWADGSKKTIERATTRGDVMATLYTGQQACPWPITIEFSTHRVYWADFCRRTIESVGMIGSGHATIVHPELHQVQFSYGVSLFGDKLYWTQDTKVYSTQMTPEQNIVQLHNDAGSSRRFRSIQVIHPTRQPPASELASFAVCDPPCLHGQCLPPGLCACQEGWTGSDCSEDVNECGVENGGCYHNCHNTLGNYHCSCERGFTLGDNGKSCIAPTEQTRPQTPDPEALPPPLPPIVPEVPTHETEPEILEPPSIPLPPIVPEVPTHETEPDTTSTLGSPSSSLEGFTSTPMTQGSAAVAAITPTSHIVYTTTTSSIIEPTSSGSSISALTTGVTTSTVYRTQAQSSLLELQGSSTSLSRSQTSPVVLATPITEPDVERPDVERPDVERPDVERPDVTSTAAAALSSQNVVEEGVLPTPITPPIDSVTENENNEKNDIRKKEILIGVSLGAGVLLLIAIALGYATLLHFKYNSRRGSWTPKRSPLATNGTSSQTRETPERQGHARVSSVSTASTTSVYTASPHRAASPLQAASPYRDDSLCRAASPGGTPSIGTMMSVTADVDPFLKDPLTVETQSFRIAFSENTM